MWSEMESARELSSSEVKGSLKRKMEAGGPELERLSNRKQSHWHDWWLLQWTGDEGKSWRNWIPQACVVHSPVSLEKLGLQPSVTCTALSALELQPRVRGAFWTFGLQKCKRIFCVILSCQTGGRYIFDILYIHIATGSKKSLPF